ncbi:MAG: addiction module protein [Armatimonadota bacterium]
MKKDFKETSSNCQEALALPASESCPDQLEIDRLWQAEIERRLAQLERGEVELIPGEVVFERIRRKYGR